MGTKDSFPGTITDTEKLVKEVLTKRIVQPHDFYTIAKVCKITELQAAVAVQLLEYKKMLPPQNDSTVD